MGELVIFSKSDCQSNCLLIHATLGPQGLLGHSKIIPQNLRVYIYVLTVCAPRGLKA